MSLFLPFYTRHRKKIIFTGITFLFFLLLLLNFKFVLYSIGNWLVVEHPLKKSEIIVVFSGAPSERSSKAAQLWKDKWASKILCTGEIIPEPLQIIGSSKTEAQLSADVLYQTQVDSSAVSVLNSGTSTKEESEAILAYLKKNNIHSCILVSSKFHTRRLYRVFKDLFTQNNIELIIQGAPSFEFDETIWWKDEQGLIFVNNEYMKNLYYWYKY